MIDVFHIGIPKSGTTTIQSILASDDRINLMSSSIYTSATWWTDRRVGIKQNSINVISNETYITSGFSKVKLNEVFYRISKLHPDTKIVVTIRQQESALKSMYKYHVKNNFMGVKSFENWIYNTNLGIDYLSVLMYGNMAKLLTLFFKKENIHFLFFEELKNHPEEFYNKLYSIIGLSTPAIPYKLHKNEMKISDGQLRLLSILNRLSFTKATSERNKKVKLFRTFEKRIKLFLVSRIRIKAPKDFFEVESIGGYEAIQTDFKQNNNLLADLGFCTRNSLIKYKYYV